MGRLFLVITLYQFHVLNIVKYTVKPAFKTTCEIRTTLESGPATSVPGPIHHMEMDLRNKNTSEFMIAFHSPLVVPNSQVPL